MPISSKRPPGPCDHCHAAPAVKPRGLCWRCYSDLGTRAKYRRSPIPLGVGLGFAVRPPPPHATNAPPGTEEKFRVLCERAAAEVALWHPDDATFTSALVPVPAGSAPDDHDLFDPADF